MGVQLMRVNSYIRRYYAAGAFALLAFGVLTVSFYRGSLSSVDLICVFMLFILVVLLLHELISVHQEMEDRENKFLYKEKELVNKNQQLEQDLAEKIVELVELKNIKQELETAKKQVDGLNQEKQDLEEKITRLYNNLYLFLNKELSLCEELAVHEGNSLTTDYKIRFIQSQVDNLHCVNKSLEEKLENESHRLNKARKKVVKLGGMVCALQDQINKLEKELKNKIYHLDEALKTVISLDENLRILQKQINELKKERESYEECEKHFLGRNDELHAQVYNLQESNLKQEKKLAEKDECIKELKSHLKQESKGRQEWEEKFFRFKKKHDKENKESTNITQKLKEENKYIKEEHESVVVERAGIRKELNEAYEELRESERLLSSMKEQLALQQNAIEQIFSLLKYLDTLLSKEQEAKISEVIRSYNEEKGCDSIESDSDEGYDSMSPRSSSPMGNLDAIRLYGVLKDFAATLPVHYNL